MNNFNLMNTDSSFVLIERKTKNKKSLSLAFSYFQSAVYIYIYHHDDIYERFCIRSFVFKHMCNRNTLLEAVERIVICSNCDEELVSLLLSKKESYILDVTENNKKMCTRDVTISLVSMSIRTDAGIGR